MHNDEILSILNKNNILYNKIPKKNMKWFLNKPENLFLKNEIFKNTSFVINLSDDSLRERIYCINNNITEIPKCEVCDTIVSFRKDGKYAGSYAKYCSRNCISKGIITKEKKKVTTLKNYNVENPFQSKKIQDKSKKSMMKNYGVEHALQSDVIQHRYKQTCLVNHGVDNPMKSEQIHEKVKKTNIKKNNTEYSIQYYSSNEIKNISQRHISQETLTLLNNYEYLKTQHHEKKLTLNKISENLKVSRMTVANYLTKFNIEIKYYTTSMVELEIVKFIESLFKRKIVIKVNIRSLIPPYELDIYIPEFNIAIEYNGLFWHSEAVGKNKNYHIMKTERCEAKGIRLIHIFEDEWRDQNQKCKDTLRHLFGKSEKGVYARNVKITEISWKIAKDFLNKYHLLNAGTCGNYRIGAFDINDNLIGVMVFGNKNNEFSENIVELKRFVTNKKNNPGLGSKMFKHAVNFKNYDKVIAFVDRRWFTGTVKNYIGFKKIDNTIPALWWTDGINRYHRRFKTKKDLIKNGHSVTDSKKEILRKIGYYRIWDSGKLKLQWNNPKIKT